MQNYSDFWMICHVDGMCHFRIHLLRPYIKNTERKKTEQCQVEATHRQQMKPTILASTRDIWNDGCLGNKAYELYANDHILAYANTLVWCKFLFFRLFLSPHHIRAHTHTLYFDDIWLCLWQWCNKPMVSSSLCLIPKQQQDKSHINKMSWLRADVCVCVRVCLCAQMTSEICMAAILLWNPHPSGEATRNPV